MKKMGSTLRPREVDVDQPSQTEQLSNWIGRIRTKKIICKRSRRRDLRMEAVLTYALSKAELELRNKQTLRYIKWQQMKKRMTNDRDFKENDLYCHDDLSYSDICKERDNPWQGPLCPELSSLDSFMSKLSKIKIPLQR
ncbi:uncharacterized protein LOC107265752 [Cephus cinctus]|uniref:Uncharacterized protein LOC107265752 n=1 Tax=Cephus cinctus TaxID=211228 RepID=A0AAJ7BQ30_CEPCN|nr:uncharacterized protein LOC107265752 [Cephus cinctus]